MKLDSVWDAVCDTVEESRRMKIRSDLLASINHRLDALDWSQAVTARNLGLTQPRVSDLRTGKIHKFNVEALLDIATELGLNVTITVTRKKYR